MLTVTIFCCLLVMAFSVEIPNELQEFIDDLHDSCIQQSGITNEDHSNYDIINNKDPKMMDYMKCLMMESKWMSPSGKIQYDFIEQNAHPKIKDILMAALDKCRDISDNPNLGEKAYNFNTCMYQADPENWFFV